MENAKTDVVNTPTDEVITLGHEHLESMTGLKNRLLKLNEKVGCAAPLSDDHVEEKEAIDPGTILERHRNLNAKRGNVIEVMAQYISNLESAL